MRNVENDDDNDNEVNNNDNDDNHYHYCLLHYHYHRHFQHFSFVRLALNSPNAMNVKFINFIFMYFPSSIVSVNFSDSLTSLWGLFFQNPEYFLS